MDKQLEMIDGQTWREFVGSDVAVLMLGKSDCEACARWTEELNAFLASEPGFAGVRFGKMLLDQRGLTDFKRDNGAWLKDVDVLPFNLIYRQGKIEKSFAGSGLDRLTNRLRNVLEAAAGASGA
ncbi:MAG: hypothetical protein IT385_04895 [Deltaproteobacteria bacterium]|nr:hypothetical protein [Deltaproteobacteria bacterium]